MASDADQLIEAALRNETCNGWMYVSSRYTVLDLGLGRKIEVEDMEFWSNRRERHILVDNDGHVCADQQQDWSI